MFTKCECCQVLKEQLKFEQERSKELTATITALLKPVTPPVITNEPINIEPARRLWKARREVLERADREALRAAQTSPVSVKPRDNAVVQTNNIEQLEMELGIKEGEENASR